MKPKNRRRLSRPAVAALTSCALTAGVASAQDAGDEHHEIEEIVVEAAGLPRTVGELAQPTAVLSGDELARKVAPSIGETLSQELGLSSTYFGPVASRPVIRGQFGERVRVLNNGLDSLDASALSEDHQTSVESVFAERIEIIRGPATLLYGSGSSGGLVNVIDNRTVRAPLTKPISGAVALGLADATGEVSGAGWIEFGNDRIAVHADVFRRETDDIDIPGFAESRLLRALEEAEEEEGEEHDEEEEARGTVENSESTTEGGALSVSFTGDNGYVGLSFSAFNSDYGIPGGHGHEEEHGEEEEGEEHEEEEEEIVTLDLEQQRFDLSGEYNFDGAIERVRFRLAVNDYEHTEFEGDEVGTVFENDGSDLRVELAHRPVGRLEGVFGVQYQRNDFNAVGEEAYVPPSDTERTSVFVFEEFKVSDAFSLQGSARIENQTINVAGASDYDETGFGASVGAVFGLSDALTLSAHFSHSERHPTAAELYADGPHVAVQRFELGSVTLGNGILEKETSNNLDLTLRGNTERVDWTVTAFVNNVDDYIVLTPTADEDDGFQVFEYDQADAEFYGFEAEARIELLDTESGHLHTRIFSDYVFAEQADSGEYLPRVPPLRFGAALHYTLDNLEFSADVIQHEEQTKVASNELPTDSYALVGAQVSYSIPERNMFFFNRDRTRRRPRAGSPRLLSQQVVAEVAAQEWDQGELYGAVSRAWPYRNLPRKTFDDIVHTLAHGFSTRRGRRGAYLHHDAVNGRLRARRGAKLTAVTNGGAIPDQFDYDVVLTPEGFKVGTLNEDFAFESMPGDIFQLGNTSYRILKVEQGKVHVEDARGEPPNLPFWIGEAPGRTNELSRAVSELRAGLDARLADGMGPTTRWVVEEYGIGEAAAEQLVHYIAAARAALGLVPTQERIVFERFFDETGDMHLVVHSPYGSRINRAWGLALRKRFCRRFNFELQAAALEDSIVLSLSATHSFPITEPAKYVHSSTVREVLVQALLDAPMFPTHWRWVASIALAIKRNHNGKRAPAYFQRNDAEDLIAIVFPDQIACAENIPGEREIPDHPLVEQSLNDCLHEVMDLDGFVALLQRIENETVEIIGRDLSSPSPLAQEILGARPYAFLDDTPAEERRTLAVQSRRFMDPEEAADLGSLDPDAIARARSEAWPQASTADELHDALVVLGFITAAEAGRVAEASNEFEFGWNHLFAELVADRRATAVRLGEQELWVAAERLAEFTSCVGEVSLNPPIEPVSQASGALDDGDALRELLRSRLEGLGPTTAAGLGAPLGASERDVDAALVALEQEGFVLRGRFTQRAQSADAAEEWCERRILARIHRYTIKRLRSEIEPVTAAAYMRFLLHWQGLTDRREGLDALQAVIEQLEGFSAAAASWERDILPARLSLYSTDLLDAQCTMGKATWLRLSVKPGNGAKRGAPVKGAPVALIDRLALPYWRHVAPPVDPESAVLSSAGEAVLEHLRQRGASFFVDLVQATGLLRTQVEEALGELVSWGMVTSDSYSGLRALITPSSRRPRFGVRRGSRRPRASAFDRAGRWSLVGDVSPVNEQDAVEHIAWILLKRYGVVFRKVLERESNLPPWRDLLRVYWRMEARGEIRGGRFVQRFAGEQFALPEAVGALRGFRSDKAAQNRVVVAATDPLNLVGIILPGEKIPATPSNRILLEDGVAIAVQNGDSIEAVGDGELDIEARLALLKTKSPASTLPLPRQSY